MCDMAELVQWSNLGDLSPTWVTVMVLKCGVRYERGQGVVLEISEWALKNHNAHP